jgi:general stress protein YciG
MTEEKKLPKNGFQTLDPQRRREIAQAGGRAAQRAGTGHRFNSDTAKKAVQKKIENKKK